MDHPSTDPGTPRPAPSAPSSAPRQPTEPGPSPDPGQPGGGSSDPGTPPPGLRAQLGATVAAIKRLLRAHVDLAKAELSEIVDEVKRFAALVGVAIAFLLLGAMLVSIGGILFLGEWIFGSIGWGVLLGFLLLADAAVAAVLLALGISRGAMTRDAIIALVLGIVVGVVLGLDLTNRGWTAIGDAVLPGVDAANRPLVTALAALAIVGGLVGLVAGFRGGIGGAIGGLFAGAIVGAILGAITATTLGPRVGGAFGLLVVLVVWLALVGMRVARTGIDVEALRKRFVPDQTIETTKETIEWVRERTPLGRKS